MDLVAEREVNERAGWYFTFKRPPPPPVLKFEASTMALEWYSPRRMIFEDGNKEVKKRERKGRRGHGTSTEAA